jgi:rod shape-determining protein MreC
VVASIAIITLDYRGQAHGVISGAKRDAHNAFAPVQRGVDAIVHPIGSFLSGAVHGGDIEAQNAKLRREIGALERQALVTQATREQLRALERLQQLPWVGAVPTVTAQVTALSPSDFAATVQLDKGSTGGVAVGMPVVGGAGLVGQVIEVWSSGCTVRLITDVGSSVGVRFGAGGSLALIQGSGLGRDLDVNLVAPGTALHKGEVLTTSGLQHAQFPADIPVARITSFSSTPSATQETVSARPIANLAVLQYVDVMQWNSAP